LGSVENVFQHQGMQAKQLAQLLQYLNLMQPLQVNPTDARFIPVSETIFNCVYNAFSYILFVVLLFI
jgi:D-alanyl-D-alanine carboxypeptidase